MPRKINELSEQTRRFYLNESILLIASVIAIICSFFSMNLQLQFALRITGVASIIITMIRIIIFITRKK